MRPRVPRASIQVMVRKFRAEDAGERAKHYCFDVYPRSPGVSWSKKRAEKQWSAVFEN
jgi:hypothetical protein